MTEHLRYRVTGSPLPLSDLTVFETAERTLLGSRFVFRVIGSSHCVAAPERRYYELCSCGDAGGDAGLRIPLERGVSETVETACGDVPSVSTTVETVPLEAFSPSDAFDVSYRFAPDAYTAIDVGERGYETWHTYPEYDLAVVTRTSFG